MLNILLQNFDRQCVRSLVKRVNSTSVRIDLPDISTVALDHPDGVHHRITYQPLVGKREKLMTVGSDQRLVNFLKRWKFLALNLCHLQSCHNSWFDTKHEVHCLHQDRDVEAK